MERKTKLSPGARKQQMPGRPAIQLNQVLRSQSVLVSLAAYIMGCGVGFVAVAVQVHGVKADLVARPEGGGRIEPSLTGRRPPCRRQSGPRGIKKRGRQRRPQRLSSLDHVSGDPQVAYVGPANRRAPRDRRRMLGVALGGTVLPGRFDSSRASPIISGAWRILRADSPIVKDFGVTSAARRRRHL
jgi:hypothetical protein